MATISSFLFFRHLRSDPSVHVLHYKKGKLKHSGRGLAFWFVPLSASIAKVPTDDRDQQFVFRGRSADFQEVTAQGVVTYRVTHPEKLAERMDFSIDLKRGTYLKTPIEQLSQLFTQLAQQFAESYLARNTVQEVLQGGVEAVRAEIEERLPLDASLRSLGLEIVSVRVSSVAPTAELEKALQAPTREALQQQADEAIFERRALAVEKERAISENELQNRIELAIREEKLIEQQGANDLRQAQEKAAALKIDAEGNAERTRMANEAKADGIRLVEEAKVVGERERMEIYKQLPTEVMFGLAAQELAKKLQRIDHLNLSPDAFGPLLTNLIQSGTRKLEDKANA